MRVASLALALVAAPLAAPALADEGDLWVGSAAFVCLAQDSAYQSTPLGAAFTKSAAYQHWREGEGDVVLACLAKKKFLPAPLCTGIFQMDPKGDVAAAKALYAQYRDSIEGLQRIGECEAPPAK